MIIRLRFPEGRPISKAPGKNRHLALAGNAVLIPTALMAYSLGFWKLAADLNIASPFALTGVFSHWQVWMPIAGALHVAAARLMRYGAPDPHQLRPAPRPAAPQTKSFRHHA